MTISPFSQVTLLQLTDYIVPNSLPVFGFLTVVEHDEHGFFGGYLLLSELGRPLEFHCTTPILPTPAQKILYGSTLRSYVLGELIGRTLVEKAQLSADVVLTDLPEMLSLGLVWQGKLAWVEQVGSSNSPVQTCVFSDRVGDAPSVVLEGHRLKGSSTCLWSAHEMRELLEPLLGYVELNEPFGRIREAIHEAQRAASHAEGESGDAAQAA